MTVPMRKLGNSGLEVAPLGSAITDAGVAHLATMMNLVHLGLTKTNVTDAGLAQLKGMKGLRSIDLNETKVTENGKKALKAALPQLDADD